MSHLQDWVHWLEAGAGARWIRRATLVLTLAALSLVVAHKQFHGATSEPTLLQADMGWQLAAGEGFTTRVNYPQTAAWLRDRGERLDRAAAFPELHQPPLYPLTIAATLAVLPSAVRARLFDQVPTPPDGFGGDYLLLALNIGLLWLAAVQTFALARTLFDSRVAVVAVLGLLLSVSLWEQTVALTGVPLAMVLLLAVFQALAAAGRGDEAPAGHRRRGTRWLFASGVATGLLFLTDYPAGLALPVVAFFAYMRAGARAADGAHGRARSLGAAGAVVAGFLLVTAPWIVRGLVLTGSPVGLAWQDVALKAGDPTAEPATVRATFAEAGPAVKLEKLGNKALTTLEVALRERLWSGGGLFFTAFFVVGWLYRFRDSDAQELRTLAGVMFGVVLMGQACLGSGEGERWPTTVFVPLFIVFGAGFFAVLVASNATLASRWSWVAAGLLVAQAAPLLHDVLEPRRLHFHYPPYYPSLFKGMREEMARRGGTAAGASWMCDVPAGAAWYGGARVWAQPVALRDFYALTVEQPMVALVLTPRTLDRPFFAELASGRGGSVRLGEWSQIYAGLLSGKFPAGFPLSQPVRLADNLVVLVDPRSEPAR